MISLLSLQARRKVERMLFFLAVMNAKRIIQERFELTDDESESMLFSNEQKDMVSLSRLECESDGESYEGK